MSKLLFVSHIPSENTIELRDVAVQAIEQLDIADLELRVRAPLDANADDVDWCDGILIGTTGLRWRYVSNPIILRGKYLPEFKDQVAELTIIGFPIAVQHIKLVKVALLPFGHVMRRVGN